MILVDTSIWIDHLRRTEAGLVALLEEAEVCAHPMIIGELALGSLQDRSTILSLLADLPGVPVATHAEVLTFIELHTLYGTWSQPGRCSSFGCTPTGWDDRAMDA